MKVATHELGIPSAQGDFLIMRVDALPEGLKEEKVGRTHVVAHSETGHHHVLEMREQHELRLFRGQDPFTCYLMLEGPAQEDGCAGEVVHKRGFDTHETLGIGPGIWMLKNEREYSPEAWRRAAD